MLVDNYEEVVTSSNDSPVTIELKSNGSDYSPRFDAGSSLWSKQGVFNLTSIVFIGQPGSEISL